MYGAPWSRERPSPGLRIAMRLTIRRLRRAGREYRVWLLVGRNIRSARIAEDILANPHFGIRIAQILDMEGSPESDSPDRREPFAAPPLSLITQWEAAGVQGVREIIERSIIDDVFSPCPPQPLRRDPADPPTLP